MGRIGKANTGVEIGYNGSFQSAVKGLISKGCENIMTTLPKEITSEVVLCRPDGTLNPEAIGWSRKPFHKCNLRGRPLRKKKWDYWCITGDKFLFSATIAHVDYFSLAGMYFLEYETGRFVEKGAVKPFSSLPVMADTVEQTERFRQWGTRFLFEQAGDRMHMSVRTGGLFGKPFAADIHIHRPPEKESLNVVIPWNRRTFQFTSKQECLAAEGRLEWGDEEFIFTPGAAYACLDYGRGIWPYRTTWNWASFSGRSGEDEVGINMGAKWTDGTGMNENGILLNGRLHKIHEDILFEYDAGNFMRPWRMKTASSDTVRLEFAPFYERASVANLLVINSRAHQVFGRYSGTLKVDGRTVPVDGLIGWAEEHRARW
jgi:hypothetical protein